MGATAVLFVACSLAWAGSARADVAVAACFGSHMVLQRNVPLPVWGTAAPGEKVTAALGEEEVEATADAAGRWRVMLPP